MTPPPRLAVLALLAASQGACLTDTLRTSDAAADARETSSVSEASLPEASLAEVAAGPDDAVDALSPGDDAGAGLDADLPDEPGFDAPEPDVSAPEASAPDVSVRDATALDVARDAPRDTAPSDAPRADAPVGCTPAAVPDRATWVVSAEPAVSTPERDALFAMLTERRVTRVYVDVGRLLDSSSGRASLAQYLRALNARCVATELLFGNRYRVDMPDGVLERARAAVAFVRGVPATDAPAALHFDLEPHVYPGFGSTSASFAAAAEQYVSVLDQLGPVVRGAGLALHVDIAHWYGTRSFTRAGRTAPLDAWVAERVDGFTIMNYWGGGTYEAAQSRLVAQSREVQTAQTYNRRAWVGLQVNCGGTPDETLCEEGTAATERHVTDLNAALSPTRAYAGVAFYDHQGLGALRP